mmetsp:Transcript_76864/g.89304  ORF Transcript_76864/g.89304 Transcript_76864/m.89304 type:complete len:241 (+) Transcript_76864:32-754(+)|eukprot:CAMPEP_0176458418 /NCGR_PEP_ID=MMETSP0127-20121128/32593_1 /TAXON_ID=938130 /ORGANISM="Platyophrya macrostoma, Strain WH" /LENGTH=240 /DNA_ID=CAMNT_0017849007 /DNA_START=15 /DNA_END=737 /DNA_ORIENTATION=-
MEALIFFFLVFLTNHVLQKLEGYLTPKKPSSLLNFAKGALFSESKGTSSIAEVNIKKEPVYQNPEIVQKLNQIAELEKEKKTLSDEAEKYNNPSEYAKHSKLKRKVLALEHKIEDEKLILKKLQEEEALKPKPTSDTNNTSEPEPQKISAEPQNDDSSVPSSSLKSSLKIIVKIIRLVSSGVILFVFNKPLTITGVDFSYLSPLSSLLGHYSANNVFELKLGVIYLLMCIFFLSRLKAIF